MVNYMSTISAELENLTDLQPQDGCDDANFACYFKKETCVSLNEAVSSTKGKGKTHLAQKFCTREGTVTMISGRGHPLTQADAENGKYAPLMLFDCRDYGPLDLFGTGWKVESIEGTTFTDLDLSGGEFVEYDDKGECPVMISNLRATFTVVK